MANQEHSSVWIFKKLVAFAVYLGLILQEVTSNEL